MTLILAEADAYSRGCPMRREIAKLPVLETKMLPRGTLPTMDATYFVDRQILPAGLTEVPGRHLGANMKALSPDRGAR
jgi:hypothetical protein